MGTQDWLVCCDDGMAGQVIGALRSSRPQARVLRVRGAVQLRSAASSMAGCTAVVGEGADAMAPINLAAAIARDHVASEVMLVCRHASGSLRSRAARAGVGTLIELSEFASAVSARTADHPSGGAPSGARPLRAAGEGPARRMNIPDIDDLDEVDGVQAPVAAVPPKPAPVVSSAPAVPTAAPQLPDLSGRAPIITLVSGRGGVGKSAIVSTMAACAAGWGMRVAVLDLDLAFGNLFSLMGLSAPADLTPLATTPGVDVATLGRKASEKVTLWGPCLRPEYLELVAPRVGSLLAHAATTHDLVLVDTSTTWGDAVAQAVQACDRLVLVADERAGAVASVARAASLAVRLGVARTRIVRLMNGCDPRHRDEGFLARADMGLETARVIRVLEGGDEVGELLSGGHAFELLQLGGGFVESTSTALASLLGELGKMPAAAQTKVKPGADKQRRGLFGRTREAS